MAGNVFPQRFIGGSGHEDPSMPNSGGVPLFGQNANKLHTIKIPLDVATTNRRIDVPGNFLWAITASSLSAAVTIRFNDQTGEGLTFQRGMMIEGPAFGEVYAEWSAQAGESITLAYGVGGLPFGMRVENPLIAFQQVQIDVPNTFDSIADVSLAAGATTAIIASNALREGVWIGNLYGAATQVRIGDSGAGAANGVEILPGQREFFRTTAALYGYNPHAAAQSVSVVEVIT